MARVEKLSSVSESAETLSWLSNLLHDELEEDRTNDARVRSADIRWVAAKNQTHRSTCYGRLIQSKIGLYGGIGSKTLAYI